VNWLDQVRERLLGPKAGGPLLTPEQAVERLRPALRELLARLEGQTRNDLQITLQLLPLGSRLALETVGAVELDGQNPVRGRYRVKVLPFCVEVVKAAAVKAEKDRQEGREDRRTDEELAAALRSAPEARQGETSAQQEIQRTPDERPTSTRVVDQMQVSGVVVEVDRSTGRGRIAVDMPVDRLSEELASSHSGPLAVPFDKSVLDGERLPDEGSNVRLDLLLLRVAGQLPGDEEDRSVPPGWLGDTEIEAGDTDVSSSVQDNMAGAPGVKLDDSTVLSVQKVAIAQ